MDKETIEVAYRAWYCYYKETELYDMSIGVKGAYFNREQRGLSMANAIRARKKHQIRAFTSNEFFAARKRASEDVDKELGINH